MSIFDEGTVIRNIEDENLKSDICGKILRALPEWFGIESAVAEYILYVRKMFFLSFFDDDIPVGFLALKDHGNFSSEAFVLGVLKDYQNRGIGRQLFIRAEEYLIGCGKKFLTVKTLSSAHPDRNYAKTRKFYESTGFVPLEEFPDLWGKENPCLMMIKELKTI